MLEHRDDLAEVISEEAGKPIRLALIEADRCADTLTEAAAVAAVRLFVRIFGAHAGNLALLFNPAAGIHLCGGVVAHLADWFGDEFLDSYTDKGRMRRQVECIPVYLHDRGDIGMQGAIKIAMQGSET